MDEEDWHDPNKALESVFSCADDCVGSENEIVGQCKDAYGKDVDLMQCMACGMECECGHEGCDEKCHGNCMGSGHEDYEEETKEHCKEFYGFDEHWELEKCVGCAGHCY